MPYVRAYMRKRKYSNSKIRTAKRRRVMTRRAVGTRIGSANAKRTLIENVELIDTKTLSGTDPFITGATQGIRLLALSKTTTYDESVTNNRQKNVVDFRGVKVCLHLKLAGATGYNGNKMFFNYAIISPKQLDNEIVDIPTEEFFRGQDGARFTSFVPTTLSGLDCRCLPINTDKFVIHRHRRLVLGPYESTEGKSELSTEFYLPIKRQIRYNATGTGDQLKFPEGRDMWLVYWCAFMDEASGNAAVVNALSVRHRIIKVFREPKN